MLLGVFFSALGVSLSVKSNLGATPLGVCPAVFGPFLKISTGTGTAILLSLFFLAQIIIQKKEFHKFQLIQLVVTVIYGSFVDLTANMISIFPSGALWQQLLFCSFGIIALSLGIFIVIKADFFMLPPDAFITVICKKYNKEYGIIKIVVDVALTAIAAIGSWILHQQFVQVGIGTIVAAIFVGKMVSMLEKFEGINGLLERAISKT